MHWAGGHILIYRDLAECLGLDQPVYGLQALGIEGGHPPHTRIDQMAAHYLSEIRTVQPRGPYLLAGASMGGMIAFEMAQQLLAQGERVGLVALIDSIGEIERRALPVQDRIRLHTRNLGLLALSKRLDYLVDRARNRLNRLAYGLMIRSGLPLPRFMHSLKHISYQAAMNYRPRPYPGRVTLFRAAQRPRGGVADPFLGWERLALGGIEVHEIPGTHTSLMREPGVRILARELTRCIDQALL
jgi:thioesterase domain-containing protein